jgi:hypothetical protein
MILSPETEGRQALRIEAAGPGQSVELKSYFDSMEGFTFVRMRGRFRLSFRAKSLAGSRTLHAHVKRIVNGRADYLEQDFQLTPAWADYHAEFTANEGARLVGPVEAGFSVAGGSLLLDDVDLEQTGGDAINRTAFRDEVSQTLRELRPWGSAADVEPCATGQHCGQFACRPDGAAAAGILHLADHHGRHTHRDSGVS